MLERAATVKHNSIIETAGRARAKLPPPGTGALAGLVLAAWRPRAVACGLSEPRREGASERMLGCGWGRSSLPPCNLNFPRHARWVPCVLFSSLAPAGRKGLGLSAS